MHPTTSPAPGRDGTVPGARCRRRAGGDKPEHLVLAGDKATIYTATTGPAGPAPHPGPAEFGRGGAAATFVCTGAELRGRLAAGPGSASPATARSSRQAGQLRGRRVRAQARGPGPARPRRRRRARRRKPHIQTDPRNILLVAEPLAQRLAELDPPTQPPTAHAGPTSRRAGRRRSRWRRRRRRCGRADRRPAQGLPYLEQWLGLVQGGGARAQAGHRADEHPPERRPRRASGTPGEDDPACRVQRRPRRRMARRALEVADRRPALHRRRRRAGEGHPSLFDDTIQRLLKALP